MYNANISNKVVIIVCPPRIVVESFNVGVCKVTSLNTFNSYVDMGLEPHLTRFSCLFVCLSVCLTIRLCNAGVIKPVRKAGLLELTKSQVLVVGMFWKRTGSLLLVFII